MLDTTTLRARYFLRRFLGYRPLLALLCALARRDERRHLEGIPPRRNGRL